MTFKRNALRNARRRYKAIQERLGYRFKDMSWLLQALTHKSFKDDTDLRVLEHLGDKVLGYVLTKVIMTRYPEAAEGEISRIYHRLSCNDNLSLLACRLGVASHIRRDSKSQPERKVLADVVEAVFGAIERDCGMDQAEATAQRLFELDLELVRFDDPASMLYKLNHGSRIDYSVYPKNTQGRISMGHVAVVRIDGKVVKPRGEGFSTQAAMVNAQAIALFARHPQRFPTDVKLAWKLRRTKLNGVQ